MEGLIDMEQKGCESIGCWTHYVALNDNLGLGFSRSNFGIAISQEWMGLVTWNEKEMHRLNAEPTV